MAERIARRMAGAQDDGGRRTVGGDAAPPSAVDDLAALRAGLSELQLRLARLESHLRHQQDGAADGYAGTAESPGRDWPYSAVREEGDGDAEAGDRGVTRAPWLSGTYVPATAAHPSDERFGIDEAVSEIVDYFEREKTCNMEPGGKPCDHCALCSSRGF